MGRQQKNIILLVTALALLAGLAGVYFWQRNNAAAEEAEAAARPTEEPEDLNVIDRDDEVASVEIINEHGTVKLARRAVEGGSEGAEEWYLADYPEVPIIQNTASSLTYFSSALLATGKVTDTVENRAEYGLDAGYARAVATYADGSTETVLVGSMTPDQNSYYMMAEGDPALYLLSSGAGDRYFYTYDNLVDKTLPPLALEIYEYILIDERDRPAIEFDFTGTEEERQEQRDAYGAIALNMIQPYEGRELYAQSLSFNVMEGLQEMALGELVEIDARDLSLYGLDDPSLEFWYKDVDNELHLLLGDRTGDGNVYAKFYDRGQVFLMEYAKVASLYGVEPLSLIDKFIALVNIENCESITVESPDGSLDYNVVINNEVLPPEEGEEQGKKIIKPTVNGVAVDDERFRDIYRLIIGLVPDMEGEGEPPEGEPLFTISINMLDGADPAVMTFYEYDANFYTILREGVDFVYITNKQSLDFFFEGLDDMVGALQ